MRVEPAKQYFKPRRNLNRNSAIDESRPFKPINKLSSTLQLTPKLSRPKTIEGGAESARLLRRDYSLSQPGDRSIEASPPRRSDYFPYKSILGLRKATGLQADPALFPPSLPTHSTRHLTRHLTRQAAGNPAAVDTSPGSRHFKALDGVRGLALLMVILSHTYSHPGSDPLARCLTFLAGFGWSGVTLFFSLSGFLIGGILIDSVGKPGWYRAFFARRALRILPLYFGFLISYWFASCISSWCGRQLPIPTGMGGISFWLFMGNMRQAFFHSVANAGGLASLWSVSVEEQFYLLFPLIVLFCPRRRLGLLLVALIASCALYKVAMGATRQGIEARYNWMPACIDALAGGALVAWLLRDQLWRMRLRKCALAAIGFFGFIVIGLAIRDRTLNFWNEPLLLLSLGTFSLSIFYSAAIAYLVTSDRKGHLNRLLSARWLCWCGRYSYAAYVFHLSIIDLLRPAFGPWTVAAGYPTLCRALLFTAAVVLLTFVAACLSWVLFEKHFLAMKRFFPTASEIANEAGTSPGSSPGTSPGKLHRARLPFPTSNAHAHAGMSFR